MGKRTEKQTNYNSYLRPIRLARINKPNKIKCCQGCKMNSLTVKEMVHFRKETECTNNR